MSRTSFALTASALLVGCVVSFDGYRAREDAADAGNAGTAGSQAGSSGRAGSSSGGSSEGGDGNASSEGGEPAAGGTSAGGDSSAGSPSGGTDVMAGATGMAGAPASCPTDVEGQPLIEVPDPAGGFYCVDRTEVRNVDYAAFLADSPDTAEQSGECSWNDSFAPQTSSDCSSLDYDPSGLPTHPVTCIDWCDAQKFCQWAGKELCGAIGGGPVDPLDFADPALDAWFSACSENGMREFPYGSTYQSQSCAGIDSGNIYPVATASFANCVGGYAGLNDMSGNVSEWENSCDAASGAGDECLHRGGDLFDAEVLGGSGRTLRCNSSAAADDTPSPATYPRDMRSRYLGFRCCYAP